MNYFPLTPVTIISLILSFIDIPQKYTATEIKAVVKNITCINREFNKLFNPKLINLKKIYDLIQKYKIYNSYYENPGKNYFTEKDYDPLGNPQLLDMLYTGCTLPYAKSTFNTYNISIENDIKEIIKLTPKSIFCNLGALRCRDEVTPLEIACCNTNIPIHIIEYLFQNGANVNETIKFNGYPCKIFYDLDIVGLDFVRKESIKALFVKYGFVENKSEDN